MLLTYNFLGPKQILIFETYMSLPLSNFGISVGSCKICWKCCTSASWVHMKHFHPKLCIPPAPGAFQFRVFRISFLASSRAMSTGVMSGSSAQLSTSSAIQYASSECCFDSDQMPDKNMVILKADGGIRLLLSCLLPFSICR
jgi:hypothetical protein